MSSGASNDAGSESGNIESEICFWGAVSERIMGSGAPNDAKSESMFFRFRFRIIWRAGAHDSFRNSTSKANLELNVFYFDFASFDAPEPMICPQSRLETSRKQI